MASASSTKLQEGSHTLYQTSIMVNKKHSYTPYVFAAKDPNSGVMTTFVPIWYIMRVMNQAGISTDWNGNGHTLFLMGKNATLPLKIVAQHGNAQIDLNGGAVESGVPSFAVKDPNSGKLTTFFGLYYAQQMLNALNLTNTWNGNTHTWTITIPSGTKSVSSTNNSMFNTKSVSDGKMQKTNVQSQPFTAQQVGGTGGAIKL